MCNRGGMSFDADLAAIEAGDDLPAETMRLRYKRSWGLDKSLAEMAIARREDSDLHVYLYDRAATAGDRPRLDFFVDPAVPLDEVAQGSTCAVRGWPAVGRAVELVVGAVRLRSATPLRQPVRGPRLGDV